MLFSSIAYAADTPASDPANSTATGGDTAGACSHNVGPNGETCVVPPKIAKPELLPGPSTLDDAGNVHERYFITDLLPTLIRGAINLLGGITIIALMVGGIQYLTAYGDETRMENGKKTVTYSIVGLLIALFSYTIVSIVSETPLSNRGENPAGVVDTVHTE